MDNSLYDNLIPDLSDVLGYDDTPADDSTLFSADAADFDRRLDALLLDLGAADEVTGMRAPSDAQKASFSLPDVPEYELDKLFTPSPVYAPDFSGIESGAPGSSLFSENDLLALGLDDPLERMQSSEPDEAGDEGEVLFTFDRVKHEEADDDTIAAIDAAIDDALSRPDELHLSIDTEDDAEENDDEDKADNDAAEDIEADEPLSADEFDDESENVIVDIQGDGEPEELEATYIRRVAARAANKARRVEDEFFAEGEGGDDDALSMDDLDAAIDAELDAFFAESERKPGFAEKVKAPLIRFLATQKARQKLREQEASAWPSPVDIRQTPELSAVKASRYYGAQVKPLKLRLFVCVFLTLILMWIGFKFPMAGSLGQSVRVQAGVSIVFLLTAMLCALDIVSVGFRQIFSLQAGMEALCAASCIFGCLDAVFTVAGLSADRPFCAAGALSLCAALWGNLLKCNASAFNLKTASLSHTGSVLTAEEDSTDGLPTLIRSQREEPGIVRRSEEADGSQNAYAFAAPIFLILSVALGAISTIGMRWTALPHRISAYLTVCANAAGFLCFALPYLVAVVQLRQTGSAIAGWAGCEDIGRSHRVIITDNDMFPQGTIRLAGVNILEGANVEKVVSYLVSLLSVSGSSVTDAFSEMMQYRKYSVLTVEDFKCHDGGGLSAYIHGEYVLVGSSGFLNLMGIRLPQRMDADSSICIAISNELVGVFTMQYIPVKGVRYALDLLMQGHTQPVFAIRDFNITPLTIQNIFRIPAIKFEFPSFRERYRLSALYGSNETPPAALLTRPGIRCAVETAEIGRRLYLSTVINTALSIASSALAMLFLFLSLKNGNAASLTCGKLLLYSILWTLPVFGTAFWTGR